MSKEFDFTKRGDDTRGETTAAWKRNRRRTIRRHKRLARFPLLHRATPGQRASRRPHVVTAGGPKRGPLGALYAQLEALYPMGSTS